MMMSLSDPECARMELTMLDSVRPAGSCARPLRTEAVPVVVAVVVVNVVMVVVVWIVVVVCVGAGRAVWLSAGGWG